MGWERRGTRFYYYRKIRMGRRVVSEYVGSSEIAEFIGALDVADQEQRKDSRRGWHMQQAEIQAIDLEIEQVNKVLRRLVLATILLAGYHPHKGQWRKNRNV